MRGTLSGLERDRFSSIPLFIPFYIFCLESGGYRSVYAGNTFDSEHLRESLAEDLEALAIDLEASTTLFGEGLRSVEGREGPVQATVDEWRLGVDAAWAVARAEQDEPASSGAPRPLGVGRVLLPCWCFSYSYLGVTMLTWISAQTGEASGVSHLAFWDDESLREKVKRGSLAPVAATVQGVLTNPIVGRGAAEVMGRSIAAGGAVAWQWGKKHPKLLIAGLLAPHVYKLVKPAAQSLYQEMRSAQQAGSDDMPHDEPVDWDFLFARGIGGTPESQAGAHGRFREVDLDDPRSVLGLKRSAVSQGQLQRAFRRELLLHHPDHRPESERAGAELRTRAIVAAFETVKSQIK